MTEYETKSMKLLTQINERLGLLAQHVGIVIPDEPVRQPIKISDAALDQARRPAPSIGGRMGR